MTGFYVHIPFCVRKCVYCDFYSLPTATGPLSARLTEPEPDQPDFLAALRRELEQLPDTFAPDTVFIGGGTPTELAPGDLDTLFRLLHDHVNLSRVVEWTCESNPGTLTGAKIETLLKHGVNRVSLGVQSFDPKNLEFLGRIHSSDEAREGVRLLRSLGVRNLNLDLIYGIPGAPVGSLDRDLESLVALEPDHAACYCLIFEDGTPLADMRNKGYVKEVDDETERREYEIVRARLRDAGFTHYEISNFARPGRECRHNLLYWSGAEYIGVGPSAHSHWSGTRSGNVRDLDAYCRRLLAGQGVRAFEERLDPDAKARETLVMALRRIDGITRAEFRAITGRDLDALCGGTLRWMSREGLVDDDGTRIRLTPGGLFVSDAIFAELV